MHDPEEYSLMNLPRDAHVEYMHKLDKAIVLHSEYEEQIRAIKYVTLQSPVIESDQIVEKIKSTDDYRGVHLANTHPEVAELIGYQT